MQRMHTGDIEIDLLLEAIYRKYGYDFRDYDRSMIKRKLVQKAKDAGFRSISEMQSEVLYNEDFFSHLILDFSVNVTEMFRDITFFAAIRSTVIPLLQELPVIKIWHAGCATGEEVYSMAIILKEHDLYHKCKIYATDINHTALQKAKSGIFAVDRTGNYARNYRDSGGQFSFASYFTAKYNYAIIDQALKKNIIFSYHNLSTDTEFCEVDIIFCRNVLIYFNETLLERALQLISASLNAGGVLCLGPTETLNFTALKSQYRKIAATEQIYLKNKRISGYEQN
jgi:chemotaxis protein methyltransferase CheR